MECNICFRHLSFCLLRCVVKQKWQYKYITKSLIVSWIVTTNISKIVLNLGQQNSCKPVLFNKCIRFKTTLSESLRPNPSMYEKLSLDKTYKSWFWIPIENVERTLIFTECGKVRQYCNASLKAKKFEIFRANLQLKIQFVWAVTSNFQFSLDRQFKFRLVSQQLTLRHQHSFIISKMNEKIK